MSDYSFYIWGAYGMTFALLAAETVHLAWQARTIRRRLSRYLRAREDTASSAPTESASQ